MPINEKTFQDNLVDIYEKGGTGNPSPQKVGLETADAYLSYVKDGINKGGGTFAGMLGVIDLGQKLGDAFSTEKGVSTSQGYVIARAFNSCLHTYKTTYQIVISTAPGFPAMMNGLAELFSTPNLTSTLFAQKFATQVGLFTSVAIITGMIPGTPPIPFSGPIS